MLGMLHDFEPITIFNEDSIEHIHPIPYRGYRNDEKEIDKNDSHDKLNFAELYKPCCKCCHDNAHDDTCIYCDETHKCFSPRK